MAENVSSMAKWWALYVRVSTQDQAREGVSLGAQEEKCRLALKLQDDGDAFPAKLYRELGESGKDMDRPEMQRLLTDIKAEHIHGVVCFALDRLSRSVLDFCNFCALAEQHGARIISVSQHIDSFSPVGRLLTNVLVSFAQFERENGVSRILTAVRYTASG